MNMICVAFIKANWLGVKGSFCITQYNSGLPSLRHRKWKTTV
jgi:hypothetical protein